MNKKLVLTHGGCMDGTGAAVAAYMEFGDSAEYIGLHHGADFAEVIQQAAGREVYMFDFTMKRQQLEELHAVAASLVVIDHHASAKDDLADLDYATFDMTKSGAVLAWEYFFPFTDMPAVLAYIGDRDIWAWKLPNSKAINAHLRDVINPKSTLVEAMALLLDMVKMDEEEFIKTAVEKGGALLRQRDELMEECVKNAFLVEFNLLGETIRIPACFAPGSIASEAGNNLAYRDGYEAGVILLNLAYGKFGLSFRGREGTDLAKRLAVSLGGGGHACAAGCGVRPEAFGALMATATAIPDPE